ncbi:MAG: amidohydrolase family protein [Acidimicrobiales bacterium]
MTDLIVSADSHVMEPSDLWTTRLPAELRDRAPRVLPDDDGPGWSFHAPGLNVSPVSGAWGAGRSGEDLKDHLASAGPETARPSGWDPAERLKDQDIDGVHTEVLYGTLGMRLFRSTDAEVQQAAFRVYNDWLADYCAHAPSRLVGLGLVSLWDVDRGVAELERCAELGHRGAMIWGYPPEDRPYHSPVYDRLWAAASDLGMPLSLHIVTGMGPESLIEFSAPALRYMNLIHETQRSISQLVLGGVLERFPRLQIVGAESDIGWLPHWIQRMDHGWEKFGAMMDTELALRPSEYMNRQVWFTFMDDEIGSSTADHLGVRIMWGSDFPHTDSTWPDSQSVIARNLAGASASLAEQVLRENAVELYGLDLSG